MSPKKPLAFDSDSVENRSQIKIPVTSSGAIDWQQMRPSQRAQILELANNDITILEHIGIAHDSDGSGESGDGEELINFTQAEVHEMLDLLGQVNGQFFRILIAKFQKHPFKRDAVTKLPLPFLIEDDILGKCFTLTKAQHDVLDPRAYAEVKKHTTELPDWIKKHLNLWMLVGTFLKFQSDNAKNAMQLQFVRDFQRASGVAANIASTAKPVDSDAKPPVVSPPSNGHTNEQPGATFSSESETLEPGNDSAVGAP